MANSRPRYDDEDEVNNNVFGGNINREEEMSVMVSALTHVVAGHDHENVADHHNISSVVSWGVGDKRRRDEENYSSHMTLSSGIFPLPTSYIYVFSVEDIIK